MQQKDSVGKMFCVITLVAVLSVTAVSQKSIGDIPVPDQTYIRTEFENGSFPKWLRQRELLPAGSPVLDYRGREYKKPDDSTVAYVMNIDIHNRRNEQCMDILIRLYADYLWHSKQAEELALPLPGGQLLEWAAWKQGWRPRFKGINVNMVQEKPADSSYQNFENYLKLIYSESHTQQFYHLYSRISPGEVRPGDFIVIRGSKSHAVMVVDVISDQNGRKKVLIGHGDTPACQFHILAGKNTIWFDVGSSEEIIPLPIRRKMPWSELRRFYPAPQ